MTNGHLEFSLARNTAPASDEVRAGILAEPGFGRYFTDHMVSIDYSEGQGWHNAQVLPYGPITVDPSAVVLHYAQEVFEGLKAYRWNSDAIVSFRPEITQPVAALVAAPGHSRAPRRAVHRVAAATDRRRQRLGAARRGEESLYLRPFVIATEPGLGSGPRRSTATC